MSENIIDVLKKTSMEGYLCTNKLTSLLENTLAITEDAKKIMKDNLSKIDEGNIDENSASSEFLKTIEVLKSVEGNLLKLDEVFQSSLSEKLNSYLQGK